MQLPLKRPRGVSERCVRGVVVGKCEADEGRGNPDYAGWGARGEGGMGGVWVVQAWRAFGINA